MKEVEEMTKRDLPGMKQNVSVKCVWERKRSSVENEFTRIC